MSRSCRLAYGAFLCVQTIPLQPENYMLRLPGDVPCSSCLRPMPGPDMDFCPPCEEPENPPLGAYAA